MLSGIKVLTLVHTFYLSLTWTVCKHGRAFTRYSSLSIRKLPLNQGIQVSSPLPYKQQILTFLWYMSSPQLLYSWVRGASSITNLTFGEFLAGTPPVLYRFFLSFLFFRYTHWHICGRSTH